MKNRKARGVLAGFAITLALGLCGCEAPPPREVKMTLSAVNSADKILVLEGETDLPPGAKLIAELQSRDGKAILSDDAVVREGSFFFDFDLNRLSEFSTYRAVVTFDPDRAPLAVRHTVGLWGEALEGEGVQKFEGRRVFRMQTELLLSESATGRDWEGRDFEEMEPSERTRLTALLERYINEKPDDKSAKLALARAYLAAEDGEYAVGSRAHGLLTDVARALESDRNGKVAKVLLAEIEKTDKQRKKVAAKKKAQENGGRYRTEFSVEPGKRLGGFRMGSPYQIAVRYFELDRAADFRSGLKDQTVTLKDFLGIELTYGARSRRLISARTTSPKYRLPEGFGVGSLLQEVQKRYGKRAVYTPKFKLLRTDPDGTKVYRGLVETEGLIFEVHRKVDPGFGIPVDKIAALTVFR